MIRRLFLLTGIGFDFLGLFRRYTMTLRRSRTSSELSPAGLRLLGFGLPLLAVAALFGGYFFGVDSLGWNNGFNHPLAGWDHLLAMLAVGIWAAQLRGQAVWMLPLAFVGVMSLGGLAGAAGISIPSVEGIVLLSCAVFALLITRTARFSSKINVLIVAFFAFFHGFAHGQEISTSASLISYTLGFMLATLLLHGAGIVVAKLVVLVATFLLTAIFSQQALAKTGQTGIGVNWAAQQYRLEGASGHGSSADPYGVGMGRCEMRTMDDGDRPEVRNQYRTNRLAANARFVSGKFPAACGVVHNASPFAVSPLSEQARIKLAADLATRHLGLFKLLFPDINQTPGTQLLANGVGRTSPPLQIYSCPQALVSVPCPSNTHSPAQAIRLPPVSAASCRGDRKAKSTFGLWPGPYRYVAVRSDFRRVDRCVAGKLTLFDSLAIAAAAVRASDAEPRIRLDDGFPPFTRRTITTISA